MNGEEIERSIRNGIHEATPDLLDGLVAELGLENRETSGGRDQAEALLREAKSADLSADSLAEDASRSAVSIEGFVSETPGASGRMPRPRSTRRWLRVGFSAAAVLAVLAVGLLSVLGRGPETFAVVGLDVNPSIEISVDNGERVLSAEALNEEAQAILEDLELEGTDLNTASHAVVGSMLVKGYLSTSSNSILVSVRALDASRGKEIELRLSESLNAFMENSEVAVAILGQYVEDDAGLARFAEEHAISLGKALLVKKLSASGGAGLDESSLLKLSTQELILLAQERGVESDVSIGESDTSDFIPKEKAVEIALRDAGVKKRDAEAIQVEFDCENGAIAYEVEFCAAGSAYEYVIEARSGKVLLSESESLGGYMSQEGADESGSYAESQDFDDEDDVDDVDDDEFDDGDDYDYDPDDFDGPDDDFDDDDDRYDDDDGDDDDGDDDD